LPFLFVGRQRQTKTHLYYSLLAGPYDSLSSIFYLQLFFGSVLSTRNSVLTSALLLADFAWLAHLKTRRHGHFEDLNPLGLFHMADKPVFVFHLIHGVGRDLGAGKLNLGPY